MEEVKTKTEEIKEDTKDLAGHAVDFLETYYQLITINLAQKSIDIASSIINAVILAFLGLLVISFVGFGLAWWLGNVTGSRAGGFFITAGVYLVVMVILIVMRKKLIFPFLRNFLTRKMYE
ncbi:MAG: phage holin family protein [Bacteroidetes bacterium]|nr:MAG: phage holin family protein [Bacteroidota bacterium]